MTTFVVDEGDADGEVVLHLHGGFSDSNALRPLLVPRMGDRYRVVGFDRRGHGQTPDTDEPFHYESMADETIAVLEQHLGGTPAHLVGYSDGGITALHAHRKRPDLVRSMVLLGTNFHHDGLLDDWIDPDAPFLQTDYGRKEAAMFTTEPTLTVDDIAGIDVPVLVVVGDDDAIRLEHTIELYRALPQGQLAVVPGTSHLLIAEKGALVAQLIESFLDSKGEVSTFMPVRRRP